MRPGVTQHVEAGHVRQVQVEQHDVGGRFLEAIEGFLARGGLADDAKVGLGIDHGAQAGAHHLVVIHDYDGSFSHDRCILRVSGAAPAVYAATYALKGAVGNVLQRQVTAAGPVHTIDSNEIKGREGVSQ